MLWGKVEGINMLGRVSYLKGDERRKGRVPVQQGKRIFRMHVMKNIHTINNK